jgi:uncharacterized protein (TIGR00156 family)
MKKRYMILTAIAAFMLAVPILLMAGSDNKVISVAEAGELEDGAKVVLEGFIIEDLGGDMYRFRDDTGDIVLTINKKTWSEREMDPEFLVWVHGEINRKTDLIKVNVSDIKDVVILEEDEFIDDDMLDDEEEFIEEEIID